jgi:REP element-mobilizing transposase RayT
MRPTQSISDLMKVVKWNSSKWMNTNQVFQTSFEWQEGYGAFSYSKSHVNRVIDYIKNQERHHSKKSFREEYIDFLQKFEIDFDQKYIFNDLI